MLSIFVSNSSVVGLCELNARIELMILLVCTLLHNLQSALMFASENGHVEVVSVLLAAGADVNAKVRRSQSRFNMIMYGANLRYTR